jgi:hypothetical protein
VRHRDRRSSLSACHSSGPRTVSDSASQFPIDAMRGKSTYRRSGAIEGHRQRVYARARQRVYARAARGGRYLNRAAAASRLTLASVCSIGCLNYVRAARTHKTARIEAR